MLKTPVAWIIGAVFLATAPDAAAQNMPRTPDGKPDMSGIWTAVNSAAWNILPHPAEDGVPAGLGVVDGNEIPYRPEAAAKQRANFANRATLDPETKCWLPGVPRATYMGFPFQIVQTPTQVSILYEYGHALRNIFMNSPHPKGPIEFWMGDSRYQQAREVAVALQGEVLAVLPEEEREEFLGRLTALADACRNAAERSSE